VLAHEIAHVALGHSLHATLRSLLGLEAPEDGAAHGDPDENQADQLALTLLERAGYNPRALGVALRTLFATAAALGESGDARDASEDLARLVRALRALDGRRGGDIDAAAYRRQVDGIVWGRDPRDGVVDGTTFTCARYGFALSLPETWSVAFEDGQLTGHARTGDEKVEAIRLGDAPAMKEAVDAAARKKGFRRRTIAGAEAYVGTVSTSDGTSATAFLLEPGAIWSLTATGPDPGPVLERVITSARAVAPKSSPPALRRVRVRSAPREGPFSETAAAACGHFPSGISPALLDAINAREPNEHVEAGAAVKCIIQE
jgi:predicted Zn-dependent protease